MGDIIDIIITNRIKCGREWSWNSDDNGWKGFHLWCVDEGGAQIKEGGRVHNLLPGDIFLFDLSGNHVCTHDPDRPLGVTTVYFMCETDQKGSRLIRRDAFLCEALRRGVRYEEEGRKEQGRMWLLAAASEIFQDWQRAKRIPEAVTAARKMIEEALSEKVDLNRLAAESGYSPNQLIRLFRNYLGITPIQYALQKKMEYARGMLAYSSLSVTEIACNVGYGDPAYFSNTFKKFTGRSPMEYRRAF